MQSDHQPSSASFAASSGLWWSFSNRSTSAALTSFAAKSRRARTKSCCSSESARSVFRVSVASRMLRLPRGPSVDRTAAGGFAPVIGRVVLAPAVQLEQRDTHVLNLVRAVGESQHAQTAPQGGKRRVIGDAERPVHLHR